MIVHLALLYLQRIEELELETRRLRKELESEKVGVFYLFGVFYRKFLS